VLRGKYQWLTGTFPTSSVGGNKMNKLSIKKGERTRQQDHIIFPQSASAILRINRPDIAIGDTPFL
jgi:hypothetical protein